MIFDSENLKTAFSLFHFYFKVLLSYIWFCPLTLDLLSYNTFLSFLQLVNLCTYICFSALMRMVDNYFLEFSESKILSVIYTIEI